MRPGKWGGLVPPCLSAATSSVSQEVFSFFTQTNLYIDFHTSTSCRSPQAARVPECVNFTHKLQCDCHCHQLLQ